jgi:hypothetical protein
MCPFQAWPWQFLHSLGSLPLPCDQTQTILLDSEKHAAQSPPFPLMTVSPLKHRVSHLGQTCQLTAAHEQAQLR